MKSRSLIVKFILFLIIFLPIAKLSADNLPNSKSADLNKEIYNASRGDVNNEVGKIASSVQIEASENDQVVTVKISPFNGAYRSYFQLNFPVNKNSKNTDIKNFKGLSNIDSVEFGINGFVWGNNSVDIIHGLKNLCRKNKKLFGFNENSKDCVCDLENSKLALKFNKEIATEYEQKVLEATERRLSMHIISWGVSAEYGKDDYEFFSPDNTNKTSNDEESYSVKGNLSVFSSNRKHRYLVELEYTRNFNESYQAIRCPTSAGSFTSCASGKSGPPVENKDYIVSMSYRRNSGKGYAIAARVSYDFEDDITQLSLPIFFFKSESTLDSGVRFDYDTDKNDLKASLFFSKAFSLTD